MNWRALIITGSIILILLAGSNFVTYRVTKNVVKKELLESIIKDSVVVDTVIVTKIDTIFIENKNVNIKAKKTEEKNETIFSKEFEVPIISKKDTVGELKEKVSFNLKKETFDIVRDIIIKPVEKLVTVQKRIYKTVPVEVPASPPFYNTFWFGSVITTIAIIILAILL